MSLKGSTKLYICSYTYKFIDTSTDFERIRQTDVWYVVGLTTSPPSANSEPKPINKRNACSTPASMLHDQSDFASVLESLERLLSWIQLCLMKVVPSEEWPTFQTALVHHWGLFSSPWRWPQDLSLQQNISVFRHRLKVIASLCNPAIIENLYAILHNNFDAVLNNQSMKQVYKMLMNRFYLYVKMTLQLLAYSWIRF